MSFIRYVAVFTLLYAGVVPCFSQEKNGSTVLFILDIAPEARSSGMGDAGVATSPDVNAQRWNAAKYIFAKQSRGVSLSYTPWLSKIAKGMNMGFLSGYVCLDNAAIGMSVLYLSTGGIELYDNSGTSVGNITSAEYAMDVSYSRRLGKYLSGGITLRYANGIKVEAVGSGSGGVLRPSPAFAGDVAFFYTRPVEALDRETNLSFGTCLSNLGTKVKLSGDKEVFLPMSWRLGATWNINLNKNNALATSFDINKSFVPMYYEKNITIFEAIGKSFDEARDFAWSAGLEYSFMQSAMLRTGYHHSRNNSGYRYFTLGAGLIYQSFRFDGSYLITTSSIGSSSLSNIFRMTLSYLWK
ncbi:MAG: type IX secretion system outer membrane channel protein PorV [Prevotellaceae bacterium]|nr:type IX secretion system outer membrane channel protein PorV [Prevotellaceae bacterium]